MIEPRLYLKKKKSLKRKQAKKGRKKSTYYINHWRPAFHKKRGRWLLLWCLFHPLPNNPKAHNFQRTAFFHRLEAPQSILHQPGLLAVLLLQMQMLHLEKAVILSPAWKPPFISILLRTPTSCNSSLWHTTLLKRFKAFCSSAECLPLIKAQAHLWSSLTGQHRSPCPPSPSICNTTPSWTPRGAEHGNNEH